MASATPAYFWPTCPRCRQKLAALAACPGCGLSLEVLDGVYGGGEVVLERVNDPQRLLDEAGRRHITTEVGAFGVAFPQAFAAVYFGALGSAAALRQFGFWLLNRAALADGEITRPNENGVLVLIDVSARSAGVTLGYQLEPWLPETTLERVLMSGRNDLQACRYAVGATRIVREVGTALRGALRRPASEALLHGEVPAPLAGMRRFHRGSGELNRSPFGRRHDD